MKHTRFLMWTVSTVSFALFATFLQRWIPAPDPFSFEYLLFPLLLHLFFLSTCSSHCSSQCLFTLKHCLVMVREPDTKGQGSGQRGRMMEGCWIGQGAKLSLVLAAVKALMQMGHGDLGLFLSLDLSALLCCASAPSLALCYPCHLCLDTVGLSPCVCVCMSHSSNMRPRRGSLGEVCEVNQGDLLFQGGGQPVASHRVFTSRS